MKKKTKVKSKVTQLVEVRTKIVLGIMLVSAYMVTASLAALPFAGINKEVPTKSVVNKIRVSESTKLAVNSEDNWSTSTMRYWESDNGDPYIAGYILDRHTETKDGYDYCSEYADGGDTLVENSMSGEWGANRIVTCEEGCYNGRCVYEYEVCPEQYECTGVASRALINHDCYWTDFEARESSDWLCLGGEFYYNGLDVPSENTVNACDFNVDGLRNLIDVGIFAQCVDFFDADNNGVHDLADLALYAQNNQDDTWCMANMFECYATSSLPY